jgi:nitrate reductase NapAB chaperone NapD
MPICSYLVIPADGAADAVAEQLGALPGCQFQRAENRDVFILVTDTPGLEAERELQDSLEGTDAISALIFIFGEVDSEPATDGSAAGAAGPDHALPVVRAAVGGWSERAGGRMERSIP